MLTPYLILGLKPDATQEEIRARYLQLVKRHTPARSPRRFEQICAAYEKVKDERLRIRELIYGIRTYPGYEEALRDLVAAAATNHVRMGLKELLAAEGIKDV
ncbi:MAG: J domain-containing protein [Acidobacteriota bacterium]